MSAEAPIVALVTGASSGIGRATAFRLAGSGAAVVVGYNSRREAAEDVVRALPGEGHVALRISIEDTPTILDAVNVVTERFGRLDVLVNNGGATIPVAADDLDGLTDAIFDRTVSLNLRGPFAMIRAFRPLLEKGADPVIVNISSVAARTGVGSSLAYCAAKGGLDALTIALAKVLAPKIRILSVSPAGVDTDFVPGRSRERLLATAEKTPLAKLTRPEDVADAVIACVVNLKSSTGIIIPVDEGRHL